jgi:7-alpha-hydroxysteroid dehydrogenase
MAGVTQGSGLVRPGCVLTPEVEKAMLKHTPIAQLGKPADIGYAARFLCSPAAAWISGQVLTVSGGGVQELD